jgi:predicted GTPase
MSERMTTFDRPMVDRLRIAYETAKKEKADSFIFEGNEYLTDYARYLLEYLDRKFK